MTKPLQGFMNFVREQGVVGLAVGLVLGTAVKSVVDSLVNNIINPLVGIIAGNRGTLEQLVFHFRGQEIKYGAFLNTLLQFLIIAAVIYYVVTGLKLDKIDRKKEEAAEADKDRQKEKKVHLSEQK